MSPANLTAASPSLFKGAEVDLSIEKLAFGGKALGRVDGFVVFVEHAVPGQKVRVRITRKKARFAEAEVMQVLAQSPAYAPPCCPHFGLCGGCQSGRASLHLPGPHPDLRAVPVAYPGDGQAVA